jgi:hypothetical protein
MPPLMRHRWARYRIFIYSQSWGGSLDDLPVERATVSWPLVEGIDAFGAAVEIVTQEPDAAPRCRVVSESAEPDLATWRLAG